MSLSTFLNGRAPTTLRGLQFLSLSELGQVQALTSTSDSGGGATQAWTAGGTVPCRIDPIGDRRAARVSGGRIDERSTHVVTTPDGVSVSTGNRFLMIGRGTFEVTATRDRTDAPVVEFEVIQAS